MKRSPTRGTRSVRSVGILTLVLGPAFGLVAGCSPGEVAHPWFTLDDPTARIVEVSEMNPGQVVVVMEPPVNRDDALAVGRSLREQAPEGAQVNARIYDDEWTARNWRTAPEQQTLEHLLVVVQIVPSTGRDRVEWVGPEPGSPDA
ncbi:MAG: hypothetical protein ACOC9H_00110 [Gemmatimonadota bacterium]